MAGPVDLIVTGRIASLAGSHGFGWTEAIAVAAGRVVAAGTRDEVEAAANPNARRVELAPDEVAIPGLSDAHLHLASTAVSAVAVDLTHARTLGDGLAALAAAHVSLPPGAWLQGHGWTADGWAGWPTAEPLERITPGRPAAIWAHDHHALWVNETSLRMAGVDAATPDPDGGLIRRDASGRPTGIFHEAAVSLVSRLIPPPTTTDVVRSVTALAPRLLELGVVAVHDPGGLSLSTGLGPELEAYRLLAADPAFRLRVHACARAEQLDAVIDAGLRSGDALGPRDGRIRFGWLKLFADGTLGSRTAALLEPLGAEPGAREPGGPAAPAGTDHGVWITTPERLRTLAARAASAGVASMIHAIGDGAARASLDALESTARGAALMPRVEHVQLLDASDVGRFAVAGIAASVQPVHLRSDAATARRLWGRRAESSGYRLASLLRAGAVVGFGTDAPVEPFDPWPGIEIAVTRRSPDWPGGSPPFGPGEAIPLAHALRAACLAPALTAREGDRGRLVPGHRADIVVLPQGALAEPVEPGGPLGAVRPRLVLVDGEVAFEREG